MSEVVIAPTAPARWNRFVEGTLYVINAMAFLGGVAILTHVDFILRPVCAAMLVLFGPGTGITLLFRSMDVKLRYVLSVALSLACTVLTAEFLLAFDHLESTPGAMILSWITAFGFLAWTPQKSKTDEPVVGDEVAS